MERKRTKAIQAMIYSHSQEINLLQDYLDCLRILEPDNKTIHRDFVRLILEHLKAKWRYMAMLHLPNIRCNLNVDLVQFRKSLS